MDFTLKWLYAGLILAILWGSLQMIYVLELIPGYYKPFTHLQVHISSNVGTPDRIMGLTLEPSWFADQISALWLPWVLPAAVQNRTVYKKRWGWITIEKILLVWMLVNLVFTLSRAGLVVGMVVVGAGLVFFRVQSHSNSSFRKTTGRLGRLNVLYHKIPRPIRIAVFSTVGTLAAGYLIYKVGMSNPYIKRMWLYWARYSTRVDTVGPRSLGGFFRYIGFGPRFVYWETAFRIFQKNPFFGVGLGNYTLHFLDSMPSIQVGFMPEILTRIVPSSARIITAKNYFLRLLAETGLIGTGAYLSFVISLALGSWHLWTSRDRDLKFWGAGGLLSVLAFLVDSFSYDSLAIPNPWVVFGLITAAYQIYFVQDQEQEKSS
jgi:O-antigen ligase